MLAAAIAHVCTRITFDVDADKLPHYTDQHLAALWHIAQANPAPFGDRGACEFAEKVGREIIRRFLVQTGPELWNHQGRHVETKQRIDGDRWTQVEAYLREQIEPGAFVTMHQLMHALTIEPSPMNESGLRDALHRCNFEQANGGPDNRMRGWQAPAAATVGNAA